MNTVIDSDSPTSDTTMFIGAEVEKGSFTSYVLALDLETGNLFWKVYGPTNVHHNDDTPFNGQFPSRGRRRVYGAEAPWSTRP